VFIAALYGLSYRQKLIKIENKEIKVPISYLGIAVVVLYAHQWPNEMNVGL
jgi:hypothetical protein